MDAYTYQHTVDIIVVVNTYLWLLHHSTIHYSVHINTIHTCYTYTILSTYVSMYITVDTDM